MSEATAQGHTRRVLVIVPFPLGEAGIDHRREQLGIAQLGPHIEFVYRGVKAGADFFDSYHDWTIADIALFEAGLDAQDEGFDAVCVDTMSDSGVSALRSVLDIPVIGPARVSYLVALMLGRRFGVLTQWSPWIPETIKTLIECELVDKCCSIRSIDVRPDFENLLGGKEEEVFPLLLSEAEAIVAEGADVICLASTTMHQSHRYLAEHLPVPVINPGPLTYRIAELMLGLNLTHSRQAHQRPTSLKAGMVHAMLDAAAQYSEPRPR